MARSPRIDESKLTKMEIRKLKALRTSVGDDIGDQAFSEWMKTKPGSSTATSPDKTAEAIANAVMGLIEDGTIKGLPRSGYVVRRGRGRVVVSQVE